MAQLQKYAAGDKKIISSAYVTSVLQKYASSAIIYDAFINKLRTESKSIVYPIQDIENSLAMIHKKK